MGIKDDRGSEFTFFSCTIGSFTSVNNRVSRRSVARAVIVLLWKLENNAEDLSFEMMNMTGIMSG